MVNTSPVGRLKKSATILKFIGLCPFYSDRSSRNRIYIFIAYSSLLYLLHLYIIFTYYRPIFQMMSHSPLNFNYLVKVTEKSTCVCWLTLTPLLYWDWSRKLSNYLTLWTSFQMSLPLSLRTDNKLSLDKKYFSFRNIKKTGLLFTAVIIIHSLKSWHIRYLLAYYGLMTAFYSTLCLWLQNCIIIDTFVGHLNQFIMIPYLQHQDLDILLHYWNELCSIIRASNSLFSYLLCFLLCTQAVLVMLNSYTVLSRLLLTTTGDYCQCASLSVIIIIFSSWSIYTLCDISHHTSKEIKSKIQRQILFSNVLHLDFSLLTKIRKTLQIINMTTPSICILTNRKIDRKLLVSLISITTTYLVVLIQFRMSSHEYPPGTSILDSIFKNKTIS